MGSRIDPRACLTPLFCSTELSTWPNTYHPGEPVFQATTTHTRHDASIPFRTLNSAESVKIHHPGASVATQARPTRHTPSSECSMGSHLLPLLLPLPLSHLSLFLFHYFNSLFHLQHLPLLLLSNHQPLDFNFFQSPTSSAYFLCSFSLQPLPATLLTTATVWLLPQSNPLVHNQPPSHPPVRQHFSFSLLSSLFEPRRVSLPAVLPSHTTRKLSALSSPPRQRERLNFQLFGLA